MKTQWQYKVIPLSNDFTPFQEKLTEMGKESWELITIIQHAPLKRSLRTIDTEHFGIFKKPSD